jgi:hypothetical protein
MSDFSFGSYQSKNTTQFCDRVLSTPATEVPGSNPRLEIGYPDRVGFEVLTAVSMKIAVFWVVAPCSLVEVYQRFRGPCCLHKQGPLKRW